MEGNENECDINHLDADVLLPPRKRLLAGLKKQNLEITLRCCQENLKSNPLNRYDARIKNLIKLYKNGSNMSPEEIAQAAGSAAAAATRAAEAARAAAEDKSAIAAKAVAAAKNALDLVASFSEEGGSKERHHKKNKLKKHVPVQVLYKKYQPVENCRTDEELARKLHQAMNSSPRISKHIPGSDSRNHKKKKLKISPTNENGKFPNDVTMNERKFPSSCNGDNIPGGVDSEVFNEESYIVQFDKGSKFGKSAHAEENIGEAESSYSKEKSFEASYEKYNNGRKRGRIKQKRLPLSLCSFKDQANPREDLNPSSSMSMRVATGKPIIHDLSSHSVEPVVPESF
ncbi:hypothetical protein Nepgr_026995 [Nepenthes gracilis]|uniref:Uncharacterized protein n=1 Tax=Nepenthes gracilis TaxID=150966 RepID=A0AAD3Y0W3_NEPGR|nr:hypothetical protein Nepgr_026995 [Nepenthes gracilis]